MRVVISGFTAAGKTTHCRLLATAHAARYVGATDVMRSLAGIGTEPGDRSVWQTPAGAALRAKRKGDALDRVVDHAIGEVYASEAHVVVDSWILPWLVAREDSVFVWLASDLRSRVRKCRVSQLPGRVWSSPRTFGHLVRKDGGSLIRFRRMYDARLATDRRPFNVVLDNTRFIASATRESSDAGIAAFAPILEAAVMVAAGRGTPAHDAILGEAPAGVVRRVARTALVNETPCESSR